MEAAQLAQLNKDKAAKRLLGDKARLANKRRAEETAARARAEGEARALKARAARKVKEEEALRKQEVRSSGHFAYLAPNNTDTLHIYIPYYTVPFFLNKLKIKKTLYYLLLCM